MTPLTAVHDWRIFFVDTMKVHIRRWGNSVAVRIPAAFARSLGLAQDSLAELAMSKDSLVLTPVRKPGARPKLSSLLDRITPGNVHGETDTGRPSGRESW
jgi:antitoxin MazE